MWLVFFGLLDTTLIWHLSYVAIVMTLPNLFGILILRKEMQRQSINTSNDFDAEQNRT